MIPRPIIVGTTADFRPVVSQDENAHTYPCFDAPRPAPVMPAPAVPGLPDDVVALLIEDHIRALRAAQQWADVCRAYDVPALQDDAQRARRIRVALYCAGHRELAERLALEAHGLVPVLGDAP